ncbi:MAG: site-specific integrase [Oscillospiraceae bacterium]|nr:site-specific integrase [Oscillospiraceae bacterium]
MSTRPEMSWIESRKKWRKRKTIGGAQHEIYGDTKEDVRNQLKAIEREYEKGLIFGDETTLHEFTKKWFPIKVAGLRPKSAAIYVNAINVHIMPFFKNAKLKDITALDVKQLMAEKPELSKSQQSKILMTLSQILDEAVDSGLIASNPCRDGSGRKKIKAGGYDSRPKVPLSRRQQAELVGAASGTRALLFVLLCLYSGLRREEALGLTWANVHLDCDAPYIDVRGTVTFDKGRAVHSDDLKTPAAYRSIPIPRILEDALRRAKSLSGSPMVVPAAKTGEAMSESAFSRMWEIVSGCEYNVACRDSHGKIIKDNFGKSVMTKKRRAPLVSFPVEPHRLRHTYITELCASGMDIKKIQYLAGHSDARMTLKIYAHAIENSPQELSGKIIDIFKTLPPELPPKDYEK